MQAWFKRAAGSAAFGLAALAQAVTISSVSPQGEVAQVQQVVVKFSAAVVPFGEPKLDDPVDLRCNGSVPAGYSRWSNDREWLYDFAQALPAGTDCMFSARADWKPLNGPLTGNTRFAFQTGGPAVLSIRPYAGTTIDEDQFFLLRLSGVAVAASVSANAWCEVEGIGERIAARIVEGDARTALLAARQITDPERLAQTLVLGCQRPLPAGTAMRLIWGKGIAAAANPRITTGVEQRYDFQVREPFNAEFSCERERASAPCVPVRPLTLNFSAPVARELAAAARLQPAAGGEPIKPTFDADDRAASVRSLTFAPPFAENMRFTIELPPGVLDDAGRPLANAAAFPLSVATAEAPPIAKFAAAPFGIIEAADPVLPITLRHVQNDLRPAAATGQVRIKRLQTDAEMLAWHGKVAHYQERQLSAKELGFPEAQWTTTEDDTDAKGKPVKRRVERYVGTREVSLLKSATDVQRLDLPQLQGGDPRPFEVVGIPLARPGYHVVEIESLRLGQALLDQRAPMFVRTGVLVTNLGVHFKLGRDNSVAWVTTLEQGQPVEGARVQVNDCRGKPLWSGRTDSQGLARIDQRLTAAANNVDGGDCTSEYGLFVTARSTDAQGVVDTAFVFSNWQQGIEPWRFNLPTANDGDPDVRASTVFDRTLLRAGQTVSMKHFVRRETLQGLAELPLDELPTERKIVHRGSGQEFSEPLQWRGTRSAASQWAIPAAAKLGVYDVSLVRAAKDGHQQREWSAGDFRVEEFRVPLVDARLTGPKEPLIAPQSVALALQLNYFSGGAMTKVPVQASALLKDGPAAFDGYDDFSFAPPRDEQAPAARPGDDEGDAEVAEGRTDDARLIADKRQLTTDGNGAATVMLGSLPAIKRPSRIEAEVTFNDPNGEAATVLSTVPVWPGSVVPGIRTGRWVSRGGMVELTALALDTSGKPITGQALDVKARLTRTISTRKRMVGGFYAYDNRIDVTDLGPVCSGSSDAQGRLECKAELKAAGQVELIVSARDAAGHAVQAASDVTVSAQGDLWFAQSNDDRIDVLPAKKNYEPGDTAKLQVRMPFREATVLVSVEREGVLATRVMTLRGDDPNIELKIEPEWGPNVYVSVLALRGRIREVPWYSFFTWGWRQPRDWVRSYYENVRHGSEYRPPTALIDLAKPAFKFGVAALKVGIGAHRLQVDVQADKTVYQVRDKAQVRVKVAFDGKPAAGASVAFAAVDEGLLALRANDSWDLLHALLQDRAWGVQTATAQNEIIGRRHYGRKAVAAGGGGGKGGTRELFDTLLLWRADVELDANGEALLDVPINDSLTTFRLVAVADDGVARFGTGSASIRVTQDLQVLAGLPPLVRSGDAFDALLTLRNTTQRAMQVHATLQGAAGGAVLPALPAKDLELAADSAIELLWPVRVPEYAGSIEWQAAAQEQRPAALASAAGGTASAPPRAQDRIKIGQRVVPAVPERVLQATLTQLDGAYELPVAPPADALPEAGPKRGGIVVATQPKLTGALPGLRRFFETYPFICLEQKTSKAIGLNDRQLWQTVADALPTYLDGDGLASYFPPRVDAAAGGSDTLTAYLLAASHDANFALPTAPRDAMLDGLAAFVEGRIERRHWSPPSARGTELAVRKLAAIAALARYDRAMPRQLGSINLAPNSWPTAAVIDWLRILKAVQGIPNRPKRLAEASQILKSRLTYAGSTLKFSNETGDFWWWLMDSADANAAKLILAVLDDPDWRDELPRMVVGALGRQRGGAWLTTTANLWGSVALDNFSRKFESDPVTGGTLAKLGAGSQLMAWDKTPNGDRITLPWPAQPATLDVTHIGAGRPWLTVQSVAAIPLKAPLNSGYRVTRTVAPVQQKAAGHWSRGDVLRVRLEVVAQADMTWVVVSDPVPGGATILGSGLGRDSAIAADAPAGGSDALQASAWPSYVERSFEAYRSYYDFLPRGKHVVEYTVRLNNPGVFALPPTRVEAMYAPNSFGEAPNAPLQVGQ